MQAQGLSDESRVDQDCARGRLERVSSPPTGNPATLALASMASLGLLTLFSSCFRLLTVADSALVRLDPRAGTRLRCRARCCRHLRPPTCDGANGSGRGGVRAGPGSACGLWWLIKLHAARHCSLVGQRAACNGTVSSETPTLESEPFSLASGGWISFE